MSQALLDHLNPEQQRAVKKTGGPLLVLAGAGSGKTRVLTYKIAYLLEIGQANPYEILAVTFTNKAANEMKHRVETLLQVPVDSLWIGTFHAICARILRIEGKRIGFGSNFTIYDVDDQTRLIQQVMEGLNISTHNLKPRKVQYIISDNKNKMIGPEQYERMAADFTEQNISKIYYEYKKAMQQNAAFDFDDLLLKPLDIFTRYPDILEKYQKKFKHILVDEYQDTNKAQYHLIRQLSASHRNVCVVGDEDQSIYRWRGADIENILSFEKDYPDCEIVRLEQNYRSTQTILDAANALVARNKRRLGKNLWSKKPVGVKITSLYGDDEAHEALQVADIIKRELMSHQYSYNDVAVLYRTNAQSRALEDKLRRVNIPYSIVGGTRFYERKEIKDLLAYFRILVNPKDSIALRRVINFPTRGIGLTSQQTLERHAVTQNINLYQALIEVENIPELSKTRQQRVSDFVNKLEDFRQEVATSPAYQIAVEVVDTFRLKKQYTENMTLEDEGRLENINELLNSIANFTETHPEEPTLDKYLEDIALLTDIDRWDPNYDAVTLMTLHSAKGLEFPVVIIVGLEDGLFPLFRTFNNDDDLEEERRLFYVGMTRAQESLYLLWANQRRRFTAEDSGMSFRNMPSRFLTEIPDQYKEEPIVSRRQPGDRSFPGKEYDKVSTSTAQVAEDSLFKIGDWVKHGSFGKGQILGIETSGAGTKLTILFNQKELKKVIAEYANLQMVQS